MLRKTKLNDDEVENDEAEENRFWNAMLKADKKDYAKICDDFGVKDLHLIRSEISSGEESSQSLSPGIRRKSKNTSTNPFGKEHTELYSEDDGPLSTKQLGINGEFYDDEVDSSYQYSQSSEESESESGTQSETQSDSESETQSDTQSGSETESEHEETEKYCPEDNPDGETVKVCQSQSKKSASRRSNKIQHRSHESESNKVDGYEEEDICEEGVDKRSTKSKKSKKKSRSSNHTDIDRNEGKLDKY
uniref:Uncharacterized protein n=1 Tax=Knipowitschia caucasica TaxID=637954 RepID=A0AAV2LZT1_KNICA